MNRPYITCYMLNSLDGKIIGEYFNTERGREYIAKYEQFHDKMDAKACMFGRVTFMDWPWQLAPGNKAELPENVPHIDRTDYVADVEADKYCIAIDQSGKLAWGANVMLRGSSDIYTNRVGDHIISVLTEKVSDAYLQYLRNMKVSYIFGGKETLDFKLVVEKLYALFGIDHLLLEGGGHLNGTFIREGLVDEYTVLLVATVDGGSPNEPAKTSFEASPNQGAMVPVDFTVKEVKKIDDTGLLMTFVRNE